MMESNAAPLQIVGVGEVLWDVFPDGPRFGGAPANFACSLSELAGNHVKASMYSAVGNDDLGSQALNALKQHQVNTRAVQQLDFKTGQVIVSLDDAGHASYEFASDTAWDNLTWSQEAEQLAKSANAICFGSLAQRSEKSRVTIQRFVNSVNEQAFKVFDINIRAPFYTDEVLLESLNLANVLKLNEDELPILAKLCGMEGSRLELLQQLAKHFELRAIALTLGSDGALLIRGEEVSQSSGVSTIVVDTVGAGDSFTAAFVLGLLQDRDLDAINSHACEVAAFVCSQPGATPTFPDRLKLPVSL